MRHFSILILLVLLGTCNWALGQSKDSDKGQFSGNLLLTYQKYVRDDSIGANTKVYKENTASADAWLFMQYRIKGYSFVLRYDAFNNSPLLDPQSAYTNHGVGFWQINKSVDKLDITMGSFYDQFGTGILFRAYEQRQIGIDYAIQGMRLKYNINDKWAIKGFAGNQKGNIKNRFGFANQVISGVNIEGNIGLGSDSKYGDLQVGASAVNRTLDRETMDRLVATINTYDLADRFYPKYNVYGGNAYFTYTKDNFSWTVEGNVKSKEAIMEDDSKFHLTGGKVLYTSMSWGKGGWNLGKQKASVGLNVQARHVDHFSFRTAPTENLLNGLVSYLPSMTRQNTYRLLSRYNAPGQAMGEDGIQGEIEFKPRKGTQIFFNGSYVQTLASNGKLNTATGMKEAEKLFSENYLEVVQKIGKHDKLKLGIQRIVYNQTRYESEPEYVPVKTITPFGEWLHTLNQGKSLRIEWQYLNTKNDQGSFANLMIEMFVRKNLSIAVADMVNVVPHRYERMIIANKVLHYPTFFIGYTEKNTVFTLAFLKQQQGVNCSGGICREEPAFSGVRFTVSSNF
ncbi:MAG: hypothetical protein EBR94_04130 [Bacteroidetes bacterium]|nr:hypothetical protein [Bacteroidota bacterium]